MIDSNTKEFYNDHAAKCQPDDYWGQVKRTVNGQPVTQDQIDLIVAAISSGLRIEQSDVLLDLCCGNGALTRYLFDQCSGGLGIDFSDFLIDVANKNFAREPDRRFALGDVVDYARSTPATASFTKCLCYGAFQYLPQDHALELLRLLRDRFTGLKLVYLGNLPDKDRMQLFFTDGRYTPGIEDSPSSPIGIWRTRSEFDELAGAAGWEVEYRVMPASFYASHYRYDAILSPR